MRNGKGTPRSLSRAQRRGASGETEGEGFEPSMVLPMPVFKTRKPCKQMSMGWKPVIFPGNSRRQRGETRIEWRCNPELL
jgi:hypothetical protein